MMNSIAGGADKQTNRVRIPYGGRGEMSEPTQEELQRQVQQLRQQVQDLRDEVDFIRESPYVQSSIKNLSYEVVLDRNEIVHKELGQKINEKQGTMYEVKTQAKRFADFLGLDSDMVRLMVTEALQNILEHGSGDYAVIRLEVKNDSINPFMISSFKHEMAPGEKYTLDEINEKRPEGRHHVREFRFRIIARSGRIHHEAIDRRAPHHQRHRDQSRRQESPLLQAHPDQLQESRRRAPAHQLRGNQERD